MSETTKQTPTYSAEDLICFGNFIRDNYYVNGTPKMVSLNPSKYPNATVDEIFVFWCIENENQ
jgi:hypothetical protein